MSRIFIVKDYRGDFQLEIGADDKITFGPAIPYPNRQLGRTRGVPQVYALRVYEKDGKSLKAVFTGVYELKEKMTIRTTRLSPELDEIPMPRDDDEPGAGKQEAFGGLFVDMKPESGGL